jgi:hypothetical protein
MRLNLNTVVSCMHVLDSTDVSFVLTRRLTAPNVPREASRAEVDTIHNPQADTRVVVMLQVATIMVADMAVDTTGAVTATAPVVPPATAGRVVMGVAMVGFFIFLHVLALSQLY